ncbi:ankyrin repeat-containing domain protein [Plectosphaerella plurivora]|uniref:Ankyrin repeat-containing domain protein n=1 Tax=Plectosphaerella plurivora TaxID=936078 RepID=A0A9P8VHG6_9PEZI|nr:ankyrin repeat-containing domain protein [Plectosphaerella plurivora]
MDSDMPSDLPEEQVSRLDLPPDLQALILKCVTYATRPLRLLELADLVEQTHNPTSQGLGTIKAIVRSACVSPLQILPDETVQVVHHSFTEYPRGQTHNDIALLCISYLEARLDIVQLDHHQLTHMPRTSPTPSFLQYAALNWHIHARNAMLAGYDQTEANARLLTLLKPKDNIIKIALLGGIRHTKDLAPIILATTLRLTSLAREILEQAKAANTQISLDLPFRIAARIHDDAHIIKLFLQHGVDPAVSSRHGETPLNHAIRRNCHDIAKALLDAGLEPFEDPKSRPTTAGSNITIFRNGDPDMVDLFLSYIKTAESAQVALAMAVTAQKHDVIKHLLRYPAINVNAKTASTTPLYKACTLRDARSIRLLLKAGADPNKIHKRGGDGRKGDKRKGWNVLYALAGARSYSLSGIPLDKVNRDSENTRLCFRLVLDAGANVHLVDWENRTALHHAKDATAAECLLEAGVNANAVNLSGETLLHFTMDVDIIRALATRVDVNAKSQVTPHCGQSPLIITLKDPYSNRSKIAKACCLLDLGADATAVDDNGSGALHYAVSSIRVLEENGASLLRRLVAQGADVNLQNDRGQTPAHCCLPGDTSRWATRDSTPFLELLITAGADVEIKDHQGMTPLFQMMSSGGVYATEGKIKTVKIMMAAGARIDALDGGSHGSPPWRPAKLEEDRELNRLGCRFLDL